MNNFIDIYQGWPKAMKRNDVDVVGVSRDSNVFDLTFSVGEF